MALFAKVILLLCLFDVAWSRVPDLNVQRFSNITARQASCPTTNGKTCVFPFTYTHDGKTDTYDKCTKVDSGSKFWCGTTATASSWGYCSSSCPMGCNAL